MKKIIVLFLSILLAWTFTSCSKNDAKPATDLTPLIAEVAVAQSWINSNSTYPGKATLVAAIAAANLIISQGGTAITPSQETAATATLTAAVTAYRNSEIIVWFFGDSITAGWENGGPNPNPNNRWTSLLCTQKQWTEVNSGVAGETIIQASEDVSPNFSSFFARYQTDIPTKPALGKYIFISYGGNDCGLNFPDYTTSLFSTQLQTIITYANTKGWENGSIVVLCGYFFNAATWGTSNYWGPVQVPAHATMDRYFSFIAAAQTVAQNNTGVIFVNPFNSYDATGLSDGAHPNDKGYAAIAAYVATQFP